MIRREALDKFAERKEPRTKAEIQFGYAVGCFGQDLPKQSLPFVRIELRFRLAYENIHLSIAITRSIAGPPFEILRTA